MGDIRVLAVTQDGVEIHPVSEVEALLGDPGTLLWVDLPECSAEAVALLTDVLAVMAIMSTLLLTWAKRRGWW